MGRRRWPSKALATVVITYNQTTRADTRIYKLYLITHSRCPGLRTMRFCCEKGFKEQKKKEQPATTCIEIKGILLHLSRGAICDIAGAAYPALFTRTILTYLKCMPVQVPTN